MKHSEINDISVFVREMYYGAFLTGARKAGKNSKEAIQLLIVFLQESGMESEELLSLFRVLTKRYPQE